MLVTLNACCQGSSHIKDGKPCQDFSLSVSNKKRTYAYAITADGHGGDKYIRSAKGSELAVKCAVKSTNDIFKELFPSMKEKKDVLMEKNLQLLCAKILLRWHKAVEKHFTDNPLSGEEIAFCKKTGIILPIAEDNIPVLYGSTLLMAVYFEQFDFWFAVQIGDGKVFIVKDDNTVFSSPKLENEKLGFGVTTSLCSKDACEEFHYDFGFEKINGIVVMSDGMTDSFDLEKLPSFLLDIKQNAIEDVDKTKKELEEFLPKLSDQGSGDDISIAGIFVKDASFLDKYLKKI